MSCKSLILCAVALLLAGAPVLGATFYVATDGVDSTVPACGDTPANACATVTFTYVSFVQNNADPPDQIRVMPGTYSECVDALSLALGVNRPVHIIADDWLTSSDNTTTIFDGTGVCDGLGNEAKPAVAIGSTNSRLEGFTITGAGRSGVFGQGGVVITNNIVEGNDSDLGAGIYAYGATCYYLGDTSAEVSNNVVRNNAADDIFATGAGDGGGIYIFARGFQSGSTCSGGGSSFLVENNTVEDNTIDNQNADPISGAPFTALGGGIFVLTETGAPGLDPSVTAVDVVVTRNTVTGNTAGTGSVSYGGGIWASTIGQGSESISISDNVVSGNASTADGGGVSAWAQTQTQGVHSVSVHGNDITNNSADFNGGGLDMFLFAGDLQTNQSVSLTARSNDISSNTAGVDGGGVLGSLNVERSVELADSALHPTHPNYADEIGFVIATNSIENNLSGLGGGGAILLPLANADPESGDPPLCVSNLPAAAEMEFTGNYVAANTATAGDPGIDVIGGGVLALPATVGEATATVRIDTSTIVDNAIGGGFVGGIEVQALTDPNCQATAIGEARLLVTDSVVALNDEVGIGGPPPGNDVLTADVTGSFVFGNDSGEYEGTIFTPNPPLGNFSDDPLIDAVSLLPDVCSPIFAAGAGHLSNPDVDSDGAINGLDILDVAVAFGAGANESPALPDPRYDGLTDLDRNGIVDGNDLAVMSPGFGAVCP